MLAPSFDQIAQFFESANNLVELEKEFSRLKILGDHRRFVVARMGSTGSTWLAKLLNSHADVFCTHEEVLGQVPAGEVVRSDEICALVREIASSTHHGAYKAAGDVGSVWLTHAVSLRGKFTTALLLRHPARLLNTRLKIYPADQSYTQIDPANLRLVRELWDIDTDRLDLLDRVFVQDLLIFASQTYAIGKIDLIVRIEDLCAPHYCQQFLEALTGVRYGAGLIAQSLARRVNQRTEADSSIADILRSFTPSQREWYRRMLGEVAPYWRYELDSDVIGRPLPLPRKAAGLSNGRVVSQVR